MRLLDAIRSRRQSERAEQANRVAQEISDRIRVNPICSDYENLFAQVRPLINEMKLVRPFAVDKNGKKIENPRKTPELAILDYPNREMGWAEFADLAFATWLTKDQLFIHVHRGKRGEVEGYSILPPTTYQFDKLRNCSTWQITQPDGTTATLDSSEVMTLRFSRSPDDPYRGVSPATSARAWAQTDDLVAQYQRAYFENGAIPATITFITASTREKYEQTRRELEGRLKGAKNKNKTVYAWRQMLPESGQSMDQIEVKTIQAPNNTLAIDNIVEIINDRLNKAVGVSNFILGDDSSAKYDNAELSRQQFIRNRVYPALVTFWSQFQFELDRITGGLGYAIQFELEIPELTERAQVKAETAQMNAETLTQLIIAGADPIASVKALELPDSWKQVAAGIKIKALEGESAPLATAQSVSQDAHHQCNHECTMDQFDPKALSPVETKIYNLLVDMANAIMRNEPGLSKDEIIRRIVELLEKESLKGQSEALKETLKLLKSEEIKQAIEAELADLSLNSPLTDRIKARATQIVEHYDLEVRDQMRAVLENTRALGAEEIKQRLQEAIPRFRAWMIARTETNYAFKSAAIDGLKTIEQRYRVRYELTWRCTKDKNTCDVCRTMDGKKTKLGEAWQHIVEVRGDNFLEDGTVVEWEPSVWNDNGEIPAAHPNCRCYFEQHIVEVLE